MYLSDLLIGPVVFFLVLLVAWAIRKRFTDFSTRRYFLPALLVKVVGAVSLGVVYQYYYPGGDTFSFHTHGSRIIWEAFVDNPITGIRLWFSDGVHYGDIYKYSSKIWYFRDPQSFAVIRVAAFFDLLTWGNYTGTAILFATISFSGAWALFQTFYQRFPKIHSQLALAIFFVPSVFFWASGILKDTITLASIGWAIFAFDQLFLARKTRWQLVVILLISFVLIYSIKIFILLVLIPSLILWFVLENVSTIQNRMVKLLTAPILIFIGINLALLLAYQVTKSDKRYSFGNISRTAKVTAYDFSANNVCFGDSVIVDNLSSGDIVSYQIDFGDGEILSEIQTSHLYASPGTYQITLTGYSSIGCETSVSKVVNVHQNPFADFSYDLPCAGIAVQFSDESSVMNENITSWEWDFGDGSSKSSEESPRHIYSSSGTFFSTLTVGSNHGCFGSVTKMFEVLPVVDAQIEITNNCFGNLVNFSPLISLNNNLQVLDTAWVVNGIYFNKPMLEIPVGPPGSYLATLLLSLENGCTFEQTKSFEITSEVQADFTMPLVCAGNSVTFSNTSKFLQTSPIKFEWLIDGVKISEAFEPAFIFDKAGLYDITLQVEQNNCFSSISKFLQVAEPPIADFELNYNRGAAPLSVEVTNKSINATDYQWRFGANQISGFEPEISLQNLGFNEIELIAIGSNGCTDTLGRSVEVLEPSFDLNLEEIVVNESGDNTDLLIRVRNNGSVILTDVVARIRLGEILNMTMNLDETLLPFSEKLVVLNLNVSLLSLLQYEFLCIEIFSEANQGFGNNSSSLCSELKGEPIFLKPRPNPATNRIGISLILPQEQPVKINIFNSLGKLVRSFDYQSAGAGENTFWLTPEIPPGSYLVNIAAGGSSKIFKVIFH